MARIKIFMLMLLIMFLPALVQAYTVSQSGVGRDFSAGAFNDESGTGYAGSTFYFYGDFSTRIEVGISGTYGNPITLDGYPGGDCSPVTDLTACDTESALLGQGLAFESNSYVTVQDFRMTRTAGGYLAGLGAPRSAVNHLLIRRNYIYNTFAAGVYLGDWADYPTRSSYLVFEDNVVKDHQMGSQETESSLFALSRWDHAVVRNNIFGHDNPGSATCPSGCNNLTIFGTDDLLFENNVIYGAPQQAGIATKELYTADGSSDRHIYRFSSYYDNAEKGLNIGGGSTLLDSMYAYGNLFYSNPLAGGSSYDTSANHYWWSNIFHDNGDSGFLTWDRGAGSPTNINLTNNTFSRNGAQGPYPGYNNKTGIVFEDSGGSNYTVKNNLFWNNRETGQLSAYHQVYDIGTRGVYEHNTLYHSSATATWYYSGGIQSLLGMKSVGQEDDAPAGEVTSIPFTNPDGADGIYGTADDDYTLTADTTLGEDLGSSCFYHAVDITGGDAWMAERVSGTESLVGGRYLEPCLDDALDPDNTDWTTTIPTVGTVKRSVVGWTRGAYATVPPTTIPLVVHPTNPRYFQNEAGDTVRLAGHQIFMDQQDHQFGKPNTYNYDVLLDWDWYLTFAAARNINYVRGWGGYMSYNDPARVIAGTQLRTDGLPYTRTGTGTAADGLQKFDLTSFNQTYFDRLYDRCLAAQNAGMYVSVMLFEWFSFTNIYWAGQWYNYWDGNVFNSANNSNGINANHTSFYGAPIPAVVSLQDAYVEKVIDTLNSLDNIIYETANEVPYLSFLERITTKIQTYQAGKAKQHLIYNSGSYAVGVGDLAASGADIIGPGDTDYSANPPILTGMPIIWDLDHTATARDNPSRLYVWTAFTRGYHYALYDNPFEEFANESATWENIRYNIGATNTYADRMDLINMTPSTTLCSTTFCLANPGEEYLVYQSSTGAFTVNLVADYYDYEWYNPATLAVAGTGLVNAAGGNKTFTPPFSGDAILYLKKTVPPEQAYIVTQTGVGGDMDVAFFNSLSGTGYAGETFYFDGTFSTRVTVNISGTNGSPVTLDGWDEGDCDMVTDEACAGAAILQQGMRIHPMSYLTVQDFLITMTGAADTSALYIADNGINHFILQRNMVYDTA